LTQALRLANHGPSRHTFVDWPSHGDFVRALIDGSTELDGVILVVDATRGIEAQTREQLRLCVDLGIHAVVPFISKIDPEASAVSGAQLANEVRRLLAEVGTGGNMTPVLLGNPIEVVEAGSASGVGWLDALIESVDALEPPTPDVDAPFLMPIEDVFTIRGVGTVVIGRIAEGAIISGQTVDLVGGQTPRPVIAERVDLAEQLPDLGQAGDTAGLLLRGVEEHEIRRGSVLARSAAVIPCKTFTAQVYLLPREEGGRDTPFVHGYRPQFYFETTDVTGQAHLPAGTPSVEPGETVEIEVDLIAHTALRARQRFAIREGGRTIGAGIVTRMAESDGPVESHPEASLPAGSRGADPESGRGRGIEPEHSIGRGGEGAEPDPGSVRSRGGSRGRGGKEANPDEDERDQDSWTHGVPSRELYADLTLFDEAGNRVDDTRDVLCEGMDYTLEIALRRERTGVAYSSDPEPAGPVPADTPARLLAVVSARETDFTVAEPVQFIDLPSGAETDSSFDARFEITPMRRTPDANDLAELEIRLYYELNLIEHVVLIVEVQRPRMCASGSALALDPPIRIDQMQEVARGYSDIIRDLKPRHMSIDLRTVPTGVRFSITVASEAAPNVPAREVSLHGHSDIGIGDLTGAVNRMRELLRVIAMDRFAGVVDGPAQLFTKSVRELAIQGRDLWSLLFRRGQDSAMWNIGEWIKAHPPAEGAMVEVRLMDGPQSFVFPWALLYDGPDPNSGEVDLDGFWGLRYGIEQKPGKGPPSSDLAQGSTDGLDLAFMMWTGFPNANDQATLLNTLASESAGRLQVHATIETPRDFYAHVEECDSDILYFYAHGNTRPSQADSDYRELERAVERIEALEEGSPQRKALEAFYRLIKDPKFEPDESWIALSLGRLFLNDLRANPMRLNKRPIVFLNTCESAQVLPGLTDSFVSLFLERKARSVIGTECVMTNQFAHPFSEHLLRDLLTGVPLGEALRRARLHFMSRNNPLGLAYTLYGSGTTRYEPSVINSAETSPH